MKTTYVSEDEFSLIMQCVGGALRFKTSGPTHAVLIYCRDVPDRYGYKKVREVGWQHIDYCQDEAQYTFTVPTFLYKAYIK